MTVDDIGEVKAWNSTKLDTNGSDSERKTNQNIHVMKGEFYKENEVQVSNINVVEIDIDQFDPDLHNADKQIVHRIVHHTIKGGRKLYYIRWDGYSVDGSMVKPAKNL